MIHAVPCLNKLVEDIEQHGNQLALLADIATGEIKLSNRGRIGLVDFAINSLNHFSDIESRVRHYRAAANPS